MVEKESGLPTLLFVENSQPFPRVLLSVLLKKGDFLIDRAFSHVHAVNKMKERRYDIVLVCGREASAGTVQDAAKMAGTAFLIIDISPAKPVRERSGFMKESVLFLEDFHHAVQLTLSGFRTERDLFLAASDKVLHAIGDHLAMQAADSKSLRLYEALEGSRMGVAIVSGRNLEKVNQRLAELLGYTLQETPGLEFPDLFATQDEYREFSRVMLRDKNEAGWHCSPRTLATKSGPGISCTVMVRRLDDFNPLKGHLLIVEAGEPGRESGAVRQAFSREMIDPGAVAEILAEAPGIVITTDNEGAITHANATALATFGYAAGEMTGRSLVGTLVPEGSRYAGQMTAMINDPVFCRDGYAIHAFENLRKDGGKLWVAWKILALRDTGGRICGMLLLGEDISEHGAGTPDRIRADPWKYGILAGTTVREEVFDAVFHLCIEISREGWEGHKVGTSFVVGDTGAVMEHSRPCTINSFEGQPEKNRQITGPEIAGVIKGLAQLDGAFVVRDNGTIEASGRHFIIENLALKIPAGYGTRHSSVAGITQMTNAIGFVVSSTGMISVMKNGEIKKTFAL